MSLPRWLWPRYCVKRGCLGGAGSSTLGGRCQVCRHVCALASKRIGSEPRLHPILCSDSGGLRCLWMGVFGIRAPNTGRCLPQTKIFGRLNFHATVPEIALWMLCSATWGGRFCAYGSTSLINLKSWRGGWFGIFKAEDSAQAQLFARFFNHRITPPTTGSFSYSSSAASQ
jgi:hypothetical protein